MIRVSVLGATGYAGIELVRLLSGHGGVQLKHLVSQSYAGKRLSDVYPNFLNIWDGTLEPLDIDAVVQDSDVCFTALPHGTSAHVIPGLMEKGLKVIDLSGDYRYNDVRVYSEWYGVEHPAPELLTESVYGLPELHREQIRTARLVGNPGCYTTCAILPLAPLVRADAVDTGHIIIDAKSGASGAGRNAKDAFQFCEVQDNMKAYSVATHRHTSEIEQEVSLCAKHAVSVSFTPHLLSLKRGILSTLHLSLKKPWGAEEIAGLYQSAYASEPFVVLHDAGKLPELKHAVGSNHCHIGFVLDTRLNRLIVVSVLDNLIKGAGGQAIQNMNIMYGIPETTGIGAAAWYL